MAASKKLEDIEACVFDAYGTLFDVAAAAARCKDALGENATPLAVLWRTKQLEYTWLRTLMGEYVDFWHVTGQGLDFAMGTLKIEDDALRSRLMELYMKLDAYPEVKDVLSALKGGGYKTAVLSNGSPTMLTAATKSAGIDNLLDGVISVDSIKIYKPDPRVYQLAVDDLNVPADRICFMSSNAWDAAAAANFGFRVVWCNRFGQHKELIPGDPVHEITTLTELLPLLGL